MDMGLDEFIKKKKIKRNLGPRRRGGGGVRGGGKGRRGRGGGGNGGDGRVLLVDARLKIIQKNRAKMRDAREKLIELARSTDARTRITARTRSGVAALGGGRNNSVRLNSGSLATGRVGIPRRTIINKNLTAMTYADRRDQMLYRTVKNPSNIPISRGPRASVEEDDVIMDLESGPGMDWSGSGRLQVLVSNSSASSLYPSVNNHSIRSNSSSEDSWLRPAPNKQPVYRSREDIKSRLEPARGGLQSQEGYRIVVSNLQPTVTHEDIKELFEDIGVLIRSRVVRPGTAEVVYKSMDDALLAVDTYHNRQLDGQPMKCMLVKPSHVSGKEIGGGKGAIVPDLHAIHKALFNK